MRRSGPRALFAAIALAITGAVQAGDSITLASTTSTEASGLFDHIVPKFREATGIHVRVVAVGTGQAFEIGRRGDADVLLVHDTAAEEAFVSDGYAAERRHVMSNDFVLVGPADDPADVAGADSALDAFRRIADGEHPFTSRGDDSGTHRAERNLWHDAGIQPRGRWYRELGSGMGGTLNTAAAMDAYTYADRATWTAFGNRQNLTLLFDGDDVMFNQYGSLLLDGDRHPHVKHDKARQWHEWLLSDQGQEAIASFRLRGQQLFFPNDATPPEP
ncbi:substrate-binding domain-containing protein [Aquisalimonas sp.]|uniref:substrate-binding domain-containing protein n=1 Tax=unclassified Aquisalimonas TaxID=2644645 RepID=UPI0025BF4561|nr:substrate-binding domain-containing protein [Aquisalimonas sp.]